jgi:hypothetical protein
MSRFFDALREANRSGQIRSGNQPMNLPPAEVQEPSLGGRIVPESVDPRTSSEPLIRPNAPAEPEIDPLEENTAEAPSTKEDRRDTGAGGDWAAVLEDFFHSFGSSAPPQTDLAGTTAKVSLDRKARLTPKIDCEGTFVLPNRESGGEPEQAPEPSPTVVYAESLVEMLSQEMERAYREFPFRDDRVGGVLFGTRRGREIRVTNARNVPYYAKNGPSSLLSGPIDEELKKVLQMAAIDPELKDLVVVGWYRSRSRRAIVAGEEDAKLFNRYYPLQWQVELILDPEEEQVAQQGFLFGSARGATKPEWSPLTEAEPPEEPDLEAVDDPPRPEPLAAKLRIGRKQLVLWGALIAVAAIAASIAGLLAGRSEPTLATNSGLSLKLINDRGQLRAHWDASSPAILEAVRGELLVNDGGIVSNFELSRPLLATGRWPILHRFPVVLVRLKVDVPQMGEVGEIAHYEEPGGAEPPTAAPVAPASSTHHWQVLGGSPARPAGENTAKNH